MYDELHSIVSISLLQLPLNFWSLFLKSLKLSNDSKNRHNKDYIMHWLCRLLLVTVKLTKVTLEQRSGGNSTEGSLVERKMGSGLGRSSQRPRGIEYEIMRVFPDRVLNFCAWWYNDCLNSNLNGHYFNTSTNNAKGVNWWTWKSAYIDLKFSEMKTSRNN
uniref:Fibrinogen C-terminal domain-containing protein n=1 Tax=Amphimedon queenslandica TaxID=400682 RepID=A0A1X7TI90_AMPQE